MAILNGFYGENVPYLYGIYGLQEINLLGVKLKYYWKRNVKLGN